MFLKLIVGLFAVGGLGQMLRERRPAVAEPGADLSRYQEKLVQATDTFFVAIVKGNDPVAMVHRAVALAGGQRHRQQGCGGDDRHLPPGRSAKHCRG